VADDLVHVAAAAGDRPQRCVGDADTAAPAVVRVGCGFHQHARLERDTGRRDDSDHRAGSGLQV
jgi:hypothetical protein